jgi:hypothetical protein
VGNFAGVAIFTEGQELVLVSEMEAGWYRYISEWRLHEDGTIRPRFGFSAVADPCVCNVHNHHVYWRFDFDIGGASNNAVSEYNDPPLGSPFNWNVIENEVRRPKDPSHRRKWYIQNSSTGRGYMLIPGPEDGMADSFGVGDFWVVRFKSNEIDDGQGFTTDPDEAKAKIDNFVNGEPVRNQDVVVWYAAHFRHNVAESAGHIVGPDLVPADFISGLLATQGRVTFLRFHDIGTGFGPDTDFIDVEAVIQLDSEPGKAFGFQLRNDQNEAAHRRMLDLLRDAFRRNALVQIDCFRTGLRNGIIVRAVEVPG